MRSLLSGSNKEKCIRLKEILAVLSVILSVKINLDQEPSKTVIEDQPSIC